MNLLAALLLSTVAVPVPDEDPGVKGIAGTWVTVELKADGEDVTEDSKDLGITLVFQGAKYAEKVKGEEVEAGSFTLRSSERPAHIDILPESGPDKGKHQLGVYRIQGDRLTLALAEAGSTERPTDFSARPGVQLFVMRRAGK